MVDIESIEGFSPRIRYDNEVLNCEQRLQENKKLVVHFVYLSTQSFRQVFSYLYIAWVSVKVCLEMLTRLVIARLFRYLVC